MRKQLALLITFLLLLGIVGCGSNATTLDAVQSSQIEEETIEDAVVDSVDETPTIIDGYEKAEYEKFNSYASENGLKGALIYDDVTISEVFQKNNSFGIICENDAEQQWFISVGDYPNWTRTKLDPLVGKKCRAFFEYAGFSNVLHMPGGHITLQGKLQFDDRSYDANSFVSTDEEFCQWIEKNGIAATYKDYASGALTDVKNVVMEGTIKDVWHDVSAQKFSALFYEIGTEGIVNSNLNWKRSLATGIADLAEGDWIKIYAYLDSSNNGIYRMVVQKTNAALFSDDDIVNAYKSQCTYYDYKTIARDPEVYKGKQAAFTGKVIQVVENGLSVIMRVNVTPVGYGVYSDTVYVTYYRKSNTESRILEDDIITLYGTLGGLKTYETVLGSTVSIPLLNAKYIVLN